jgi:hypothetical protein
VRREPLDPDNYHDGYAEWSGTSFAAPELAARIARQMTISDGAGPADLRLAEPGADAALRRTVDALETLGWTPAPVPGPGGAEGGDSG